MMYGLKINFHKSEVIGIGVDNDRVGLFEEIFTCKRGVLPLKYLGIHVVEERLKNSDWDLSVGKMKKGWFVGWADF